MAKSSSNYKLDALQSLEELFSCGICQQKYDDDQFKAKMLQCHHTFCIKCLDAIWLKRDRSPEMKCPVCKEISNLGETGVQELRGNHYLNQFSDVLIEIEKTFSLNEKSSSEDIAIASNDVCVKHANTIRLFWCKTCQQPICCHCQVIDHNINQDHLVVNFEDAKLEVTNQILEYQCDLGLRIKKIEEMRFALLEHGSNARFDLNIGLGHAFDVPHSQLQSEVSDICDLTYKGIFTEREELEDQDLNELCKSLSAIKELAVDFGNREASIRNTYAKIEKGSNSQILLTFINSDYPVDPDGAPFGLHCVSCGHVTELVNLMSPEDPQNLYKVKMVVYPCPNCGLESLLFGQTTK